VTVTRLSPDRLPAGRTSGLRLTPAPTLSLTPLGPPLSFPVTDGGRRVEEQAKGGDGPANPLDSFLSAANCFVANTFAALARSGGHSNDAALLEANVETLTEQFRRMTERVQRGYAGVDGRIRVEVDEFLDLQQGRMIACNTERTAAAVLAKGVSEAFLTWLARNLQEIKKIIRMILRMIFSGVPSWYDDIALLIDSLAHIVLSLFAALTGLNAPRVASELSKSEQNFWAEMAALDRIAGMRRPMRRDNED
jgi:hypothetical protein